MKNIKVVAAIIKENGRYLATQRGYGEFKGMWEFPGGKIEGDEVPEEALAREIREELEISLKHLEYLCTVDYTYPTFHLSMDCFLCEIESGQINLTEHLSAAWLTPEELDQVNWLPADIAVVQALLAYAPFDTTKTVS